jgi:hypothetical protein
MTVEELKKLEAARAKAERRAKLLNLLGMGEIHMMAGRVSGKLNES